MNSIADASIVGDHADDLTKGLLEKRDGEIVSHHLSNYKLILEDGESSGSSQQVVQSCEEDVSSDDFDHKMWEFLEY
jgi:hypothetical protein